MTDKKMEVVFAPGCFDNFDGTQEELDALIKEIQEGVANGTLFEKSTPVSIDSLLENLDEDEVEQLLIQLDALEDSDLDFETDVRPRTLQ